jgi:hypothetical protein
MRALLPEGVNLRQAWTMAPTPVRLATVASGLLALWYLTRGVLALTHVLSLLTDLNVIPAVTTLVLAVALPALIALITARAALLLLVGARGSATQLLIQLAILGFFAILGGVILGVVGVVIAAGLTAMPRVRAWGA